MSNTVNVITKNNETVAMDSVELSKNLQPFYVDWAAKAAAEYLIQDSETDVVDMSSIEHAFEVLAVDEAADASGVGDFCPIVYEAHADDEDEDEENMEYAIDSWIETIIESLDGYIANDETGEFTDFLVKRL